MMLDCMDDEIEDMRKTYYKELDDEQTLEPAKRQVLREKMANYKKAIDCIQMAHHILSSMTPTNWSFPVL